VTFKDEVKELDGETATATKDLFKVNMEDLLFDGAFGESGTFNANVIPSGTEIRTFTLTVAEGGDSREIAVNLKLTLDQGTETSIYHREGEPGAYYYVKVRDAALTSADSDDSSGETFSAFTTGAVTDLQNAFVWVDHHGEGGTSPTGFANGTTEGYSEYRLFLKKSQKIGKIGFVIYGGESRNNISIELYGTGSHGAKELEITRNDSYVEDGASAYQLNYYLTAQSFIILATKSNPKYTALILGKNITVDAKGSVADPVASTGVAPWGKLKVSTLFYIFGNSLLIMHDNSKITGYYNANSVSPITVDKSYNGKFYMYGGAITDNVITSGKGAIRAKSVSTSGPQVYLSGTYIISNKNPTGGANNTKVTAY
jgi:hypothetical protein